MPVVVSPNGEVSVEIIIQSKAICKTNKKYKKISIYLGRFSILGIYIYEGVLQTPILYRKSLKRRRIDHGKTTSGLEKE